MNVTSRSDVGLMTVSPRMDASGVPVGLGDVPKAGQSIGKRPDRDRFGEVEELVGSVLFLACEEASGFVNGACIPIDGAFAAYSGV